MQVDIKVNRKGKPAIKASIDFATGEIITSLTLPIEASANDLADLATILSGDLPIQVVLSNPQLALDDMFQKTEPGSSK